MELEDKDLKKIYQSHIKENPVHKTGCPDVEELIRSFSKEMGEKEKIKVIDHISSCGNCYKIFEIMRQILKESKKLAGQFEGFSLSETEVEELRQKAQDRIREFEKPERAEKQAGFIKTFIALFKAKSAIKYATVIAGIFVVALAALFVLKIPRTIQESVLRGEKQERIQLISPKGELQKPPTHFQWISVPGVKEYEVVLLDHELTRLWSSEKTEGHEMPIPAEFQNRLQREKIYYWKVVIFNKDGTENESKLQEFRLVTDQKLPD